MKEVFKMRTTTKQIAPSAPRPHWMPEGASHNIGGHIANPGEQCKHRFERHGIWWVDGVICLNCHEFKHCEDLKRHVKFIRGVKQVDALQSEKRGVNYGC